MNRFRLLACGLMLILAACEQQAETPGGDNGALTLPTTGSSVRVLKGEDFENGTVAVTLPDLGADERVAVINLGYADGYLRGLAAKIGKRQHQPSGDDAERIEPAEEGDDDRGEAIAR